MLNVKNSNTQARAAAVSKSSRATIGLQLPRLRPDQWKIAIHPAKFKYICMGRRWGKTVMAGAITMAAANAGNAVAWVAPTYKNTRPLWRFAESVALPVVSKGVEIHRAEREIKFPGGGWLGMYSADNISSILGNAFDLVVIDEAARVSEEAWTEAIQPTLADRDGQALLISTPKGRNWFWREWMRGLGDGVAEAAFTAPSSDNPSPSIKRAAEQARNRVSERVYRQEWLAEFVEDGGGVFRNVRRAVRATPQTKPIENHTYVAGLDWALTSDYTVLTIVDATTKEVAYTARFNGVEYALQRQRIVADCQRFGVMTVVAEENAMGKPNNDMLRREGLKVRDFTTTAGTKSEIVENLAAAFDHDEIGIPNDPILIGELEAYEQERRQSGSMKYGAPQGMHDDMVMSLALAWWNIKRRFAYGS